ncbi:MAG: transmembrane 220 family protein [Balneolaceae bacterium]|nr:transmembrane 220 family protein [Balneolaceae bacterium]
MLRYINYLAIIVFALAAIVQYNDVDALRWMLIYGAASVLSILYALKRLHWATSTVLAIVCLIWALFIVPDLTLSGFQHMFDEVRMIQTGVEAAREFLGLLLISSWMTLLTYATRNTKESG